MAMNKSLGEMLRFVSMDESQALQDVCDYNDISEDQLMIPENITILEMFLFNFPRICCMTFFPNLTSLSLVQQNLKTIEGLHCLPHLEILRLSENEIQRIEGLSNCLKLKEVFLQNNCITRIANLSHLSHLRVLWLANNLIKWVEGLENLQIKELNIAKNPLCQLGNILKLKTLKNLNVSATAIGSFKEISNLTRLKKLKDLRFFDPHWGPSPLALLNNYQTYILFRLQDLQKLDTIHLTDEAKQSAKATYTRKRVYYNLCIKTLQQSKKNTNNFVRESKEIKRLQRTLAEHIKASRDLDKNIMMGIDLSSTTSREPSPTVHKWCMVNSASVNQEICTLVKMLDLLKKELQSSKEREQAAIDLSIHWLMVELDSGGNIRMEIGSSKDIWYKSCVELVMSRFFVDDYAPLGICGIQVNKVTRIHNRFLQDRFEKQHEQQMLKSGNKNVEYLLCGETLQMHNELQWIVEGGFPLPLDGVMNIPNSSPVLLSNSVGLADCCRLKVLAEHPNISSMATTGWVLVVRTCIGISVKDVHCKYTQIPCTKECGGSFMVDGDGTIAKKSYPHADSVYRCHPTDSKQRSWFLFDAAIVVPEYLVEFEYSLTQAKEDLDKQTPKLYSKFSSGVTHLLENDQGCSCPNFYSESSLPLNSEADLLSLSHIDSPCNTPDVELTKVRLSCHPSPMMPKLFSSLSTDFILGAKRYDALYLQFITYLNFHDSNISEIEALGGLHCLQVLILCFNKISKIIGLDDLAKLERLDLSYNLVTKIEGLNSLGSLINLDLGGNQIWNPTDLVFLKVPKLLSLNLRANPIADDSDYPAMVLKVVSSLIELDHNSISSEDQIKANQKDILSSTLLFSSLTPNKGSLLPCMVLPTHKHHIDVKDKTNSKPKYEIENYEERLQPDTHAKNSRDQPPSPTGFISQNFDDPSTMSYFQLNATSFSAKYDILKKGSTPLHNTIEEDWLENVEELHLEQQNLMTMHSFDRLPNLRRLFVCNNKFSIIEGLDECSVLEELFLSDNNIKQVKKLKHVKALWRLDLSYNNLICCGELGSFQALEQLSIECNKIQSLKGLDALVLLMELYAANNLLAEFSEINHIKNLPKLIVVDLSRNGLCESNEYRMHTLYTLRKLKVLDGMNVETNELTLARNRYMGRLTEDVLQECMGHGRFSKLEVLDLSGQKLRSCGEVFENPDLFSLRELNLNDNMLSSIHGLRLLENLRILQLENNELQDRPLLEAPNDDFSEVTFPCTSDINEYQCQTSFVSKRVSPQNYRVSLPQLEILKLGGNSISSISSLYLGYKFPNLKLLALQNNKIAKVDGLAGLNFLEKLYLEHNEIKEIEEFSFDQVENLHTLNLSYNSLKTLEHIDNLVFLENLDLAYNQIASNRMGGLASIENISCLSRLLKLSFINNPICRQNLYRISIVSKISQLHYLDEREITKDERQEAQVYVAGSKEPNNSLMESNGVPDHHARGPSMVTGIQLKIPLKVTSLNFESMCLQQSPRGAYQFTNPRRSGVTIYNHLPTFLATKAWYFDDPKQQFGVLHGCLEKNQPKVKGKGENKAITTACATYVKSHSPPKDWTQKLNIQNKGFVL